MTEPQWAVIRDKRALKAYTVQLQAFKATDDPPRLENHRTLPHPLQWEWEAQRHVRALVQQYKAGDVVLLRLGPDADLWGAVHIRPKSNGARMVVSLEVMAVAKHMRGSRGNGPCVQPRQPAPAQAPPVRTGAGSKS